MQTQTMLAVRQTAFGGPDVLGACQLDAPVPKAGEVSIAVKAAGVSFGETLIRRGRFPAPGGLPWTPGFEVSGEIVDVGPGVQELAVGERVVAMLPGGGGYATLAVAPTWTVARLPDAHGFAEGVALVSNGLSALGLLEHAPLRPGQTVLVTSAAGGVGTLAVQLAAILGAGKVIGLVGSPDKLATVREMAAEAVCYTDGGWTDEVRRLTEGRGVDLVLDAVGGALFGQCFDVLAEGGTMVPYGASCGDFGDIDAQRLQRLAFAGQRVAGFVLTASLLRDPSRVRTGLDRLLSLAAQRSLRPIVGMQVKLAEAARAHALLESRTTRGKLVLVP